MMRWMREQKRDDDLEDEPGGRRKIIQAHAMTTMVETRGGRAAHVPSTPRKCVGLVRDRSLYGCGRQRPGLFVQLCHGPVEIGGSPLHELNLL